jgi:hypothetical protein
MGSLVFSPGAALRMLRKRPDHILKMCNRCHLGYLQEYAKAWMQPLTISFPDMGGYNIYVGGFWEAWLRGLGNVCECKNKELPESCKC